MPTVGLPFTNGLYVLPSLPASNQECLNLYPVPMQAPAINKEILLPSPGISQVVAAGSVSASRGAHVMQGVLYVVQGSGLYKVISGTRTLIGTISGSGRVWMADNGTQLCVLVPRGDGYIYNRTSDTLVTITDGDFRASGNPESVVFVDSYFVFTTDEKKFICSAPNDGTSYNALDFGSAASSPDEVVAAIVYRNQLFIAGDQTIEGFQNIGGADFPFQRTGLFIQKGVYAPFSLINTQDSFMFVGGGVNEAAAVWMVQGNAPQKVSTDSIDSILQGLTEPELKSIYAWTYAQDGAYFVGFALPDQTLVFDFTSQKWHRRQSLVLGNLGAYRVSSVVQVGNTVLVTDRYDGRIGELSANVYDEYGNEIVKQFSTMPFQNDGKSVFIPQIELTVESGVGNVNSPDPVVTMDRSVDGRNWIAPRPRPLGRIGEYRKRAIWRRNGRAARFELFRFTCTDKVRFAVLGLSATVEGGVK